MHFFNRTASSSQQWWRFGHKLHFCLFFLARQLAFFYVSRAKRYFRIGHSICCIVGSISCWTVWIHLVEHIKLYILPYFMLYEFSSFFCFIYIFLVPAFWFYFRVLNKTIRGYHQTVKSNFAHSRWNHKKEKFFVFSVHICLGIGFIKKIEVPKNLKKD